MHERGSWRTLLDLHVLLLGLRVASVLVRVVFERQIAEGLLNLLARGIARDAEHLVVVGILDGGADRQEHCEGGQQQQGARRPHVR